MTNGARKDTIMTTTDTFQKEIRYDRETRDFCATLDGNCIGYFASRHEAEVALDQVAYDLLVAGQTRTATELDGGSDAATTIVVPNPGIHVNNYTVVLSQPGQSYCYETKALCDACRAQTPSASKMGEVINGYCDACGIGPSVSHFRLENAITPEQPAEMSSDTAQSILDAINEAQRQQLQARTPAEHNAHEAIIAELRAELDAYGYTTRHSSRTGAYVPASAHGWRYVSGVRAHYTAPAQVNWSGACRCRRCGSART